MGTLKNWMTTEQNFLKISKRRLERLKRTPRVGLKTGLPAIDDSTGGLLANDFWVIGADTGAGKTHIASLIAENVAKQSKKVVMFALESYEDEILDRLIWRKLASRFFSDPEVREGIVDFRYKNWINGDFLHTKIYKLEEEIGAELEKELGDNLIVRYPEVENFYVDTFEEEIHQYTELRHVELIIVDHLHFFNYREKDEYKEIKRIVQKLRNIALMLNIPIVLISHLRKKDRKNAPLCPDLEEFHGSSEITKHATCVITLSPAYDIGQTKVNLCPTYFRIAKERYENVAKRYLFGTVFDLETSSYYNSYTLYKLKNYGTEKEEVPFLELPAWVNHAKTKTI